MLQSMSVVSDPIIRTKNGIILPFMNPIPYRRLWNIVLMANRCDGVLLSNHAELSKYGYDNIVILTKILYLQTCLPNYRHT